MAVITKQELEDAQRDAADLGLVVNGAATLNGDGTVSTRLGEPVKTLSRLQQDFTDKVNGAQGLTQYYGTLAEGVAAVAVDDYFTSDETGRLRTYQRTATAPYYVDQGDGAAPLSTADLYPGKQGLYTPPWALNGDPTLLDPAYGDYTLTEDVVNLFLIWGQSWAQGNNASGDATYSSTALHPGYSRCPSVGVNPRGASWTALTDLREGINPTNSKESIATRADDWIQQKAIELNGTPLRTVWLACAEGGNPFQTLKKGTPRWSHLIADVARINDIVRSEGRRLVCRGFNVLHGEEDWGRKTSAERYARNLRRILWQVNEAVAQITGQRERVRGFTYQVNRGGSAVIENAVEPAFAQLAVHGLEEWVCVGPVYFAEADGPRTGGTGSHLSAEGFATVGEHFGEVISKELFGGGFDPIHIVSAKWTSYSGTYTARLRYSAPVMIDMSSAIVDDTALTGNKLHGLGYLDDGSGTTVSAIAEVASSMGIVVTGQVVSFTGASSPTSSSTLTNYGVTSPQAISITLDGVPHGFEIYGTVSIGEVCDYMASLVSGAVSDGLTVTYPGGVVITGASVKTSFLDVTLSAAPVGKRPRLQSAVVATGDFACGRLNGARSTIRSPYPYGQSVTGEYKYHWACMQEFDLPYYATGVSVDTGVGGLGTFILAQNTSGASVASSGTTTGDKLTRGVLSSAGAWTAGTTLNVAHTYRNISGATCPNNSLAMFQRIS